MIVENEGCVVPDEDLRSGKRARVADESTSGSRKRYRRKGTEMNFDIHPDAMECHYNIAQSSGLINALIMTSLMMTMRMPLILQ
jgi:hypothetical protein